MGTTMRRLLPFLLAAIAACADVGRITVLAVSVATYVPDAADLEQRARVEVFDIREQRVLERTALSTSLGTIEFQPRETLVIERLVQALADRLLAGYAGMQTMPEILCGIRVFDVTTPSTMLYWDMNAEIELLLRVGERERLAKGAATERTWIYPSQEHLQRVTDRAVGVLAADIDVALAELLLAPD